jgi:hypothetical protein
MEALTPEFATNMPYLPVEKKHLIIVRLLRITTTITITTTTSS